MGSTLTNGKTEHGHGHEGDSGECETHGDCVVWGIKAKKSLLDYVGNDCTRV